ncbi:hypothetical protein K488DRAFT_70522 [Vararia minispora EC-137]|uniref:Uncharacterized protein n=1 Tax=Vararia minispora EC-137 TaxID=1314806 RepID=A0ACB8QL21_9AGAM|nr:hypothetical protein K488DRAFT_70522 [Vararia minispora EC-137]
MATSASLPGCAEDFSPWRPLPSRVSSHELSSGLPASSDAEAGDVNPGARMLAGTSPLPVFVKRRLPGRRVLLSLKLGYKTRPEKEALPPHSAAEKGWCYLQDTPEGPKSGFGAFGTADPSYQPFACTHRLSHVLSTETVHEYAKPVTFLACELVTGSQIRTLGDETMKCNVLVVARGAHPPSHWHSSAYEDKYNR